MLSVSARRTMTHYGHKHVCLTHKVKVDKNHIDECDHLKVGLKFKVTEFNDEMNQSCKYTWKTDRLKEAHEHFMQLNATLEYLEKVKKVYVSVQDSLNFQLVPAEAE